MRDLTSRALDTATALGATYADVRVVRRLEESITIKSGRVEGVAGRRERGLRRPRPRRRRLGLRRQPRPDHGRGGPGRRARPSGSPARARPRSATRSSSTTARRRTAASRRPSSEDPFAVPLDRKIADLLDADRAMNAVKGIAWTESLYGAQREEKTFAASRRQLHRAGDHAHRRGPRGQRDRRRRAPAPQLPRQRRRLGARPGYEFVRAMDLAGNAERIASEAVELLTAPPLPAGTRTILLHPSQLYMQVHESCGHPTELDRAFGTEASYAGTSFLTPDMLRRLPLRLGPVRHRGRRHGPGRPRHVRLGRRGRRRPAGPADQGGDLRRAT